VAIAGPDASGPSSAGVALVSNGANNQTGTTASFTPVDGLLVVAISTLATTGTTAVPTNTGTGIGTWTKLAELVSTTNANIASIWCATATGASAITVTVTVTADGSGLGNGTTAGNFWCDVFTGTGTQTGNGTTTNTSTTVNISPTVTTTVTGSRVIGVANDANGGNTCTSTDSFNQFTASTHDDGLRAYKAANSGAPGSVSINFNLSAGSTVFWTYALAEIIAAPAGPTINTQPQSVTLTDFQPAVLSVSATASAGSLTYQWQDNRTGSFANTTDGTGATSATYTSPPFLASQSPRRYRVIVTDSNGSVTSNPAWVTVRIFDLVQPPPERSSEQPRGLSMDLDPGEWW
jgi:hypothetical protein